MQTIGGVRSAIEKKTGEQGAMAGTALIAAMVFAGLGWLGYEAGKLVGGRGFDTTVYDMLLLGCGVLTFAFSLPSILGSFFGSSDINDLLPLPVSPLSIALAKALSALTASYLWTLVFVAGPLAGWGIAAGAGIHYWVTSVLAIIFTPLMPTAYAGTISIVIASLFKRVRRKDSVTTITTVLTLALSIGGFLVSNNLHLSNGVTQALGSISESMGSVVMAFPAYGFAVYALANPDPLGAALFVLISLAAFAVFVLVACVLYLRIVTSLSSSGGGSTSFDGEAVQERTPILASLVRTETRKIYRNSSVLLNYVIYPLFITPALFVFMNLQDTVERMSNLLSSMDNVATTAAGILLIIFMLLATLTAGTNKIATTAISREGSNWTHMKYLPVPMATQVLAKIMPGFIVNVLITLIFMGGCSYVLVAQLGSSPVIAIGGIVYMLGASWLMTCAGAWCESRSPRVTWGNDGDVNVKSLGGGDGSLRSVLIGLAYSLALLLITPLVGLDPVVFTPVLALAGVIVALILGRQLLAATVRNIEAYE
jgi:ABC-2 type transport system permease protein